MSQRETATRREVSSGIHSWNFVTDIRTKAPFGEGRWDLEEEEPGADVRVQVSQEREVTDVADGRGEDVVGQREREEAMHWYWRWVERMRFPVLWTVL